MTLGRGGECQSNGGEDTRWTGEQEREARVDKKRGDYMRSSVGRGDRKPTVFGSVPAEGKAL